MDVETEVLSLSLTTQAANALRDEAKRTNGSIDNIADRLIRQALAAISPTTEDAEKCFSLANIERAWSSGYSTGQDYRDDPPFAGLGKHNRQHGWELFACSLGDRNTATEDAEKRALVEAFANCTGIESGPNGRGGMRVAVHFQNGGDEYALFTLLSKALASIGERS